MESEETQIDCSEEVSYSTALLVSSRVSIQHVMKKLDCKNFPYLPFAPIAYLPFGTEVQMSCNRRDTLLIQNV